MSDLINRIIEEIENEIVSLEEDISSGRGAGKFKQAIVQDLRELLDSQSVLAPVFYLRQAHMPNDLDKRGLIIQKLKTADIRLPGSTSQHINRALERAVPPKYKFWG